jgi:hypothetical protein
MAVVSMQHPFRDLLDAYLFTKFPRRFGIPPVNAFMVQSYEQLYGEIVANNGKRAVYTSHNAIYLNQESDGEIKIPYVDYVQMFWDIDDDNKDPVTGEPLTTLDDALEDMKKLSHYFEDYNKMLSWSGNGFQFDLRIEPMILKQDAFLTSAIKNFQRHVAKKIGLKCVNLVCAEPVHLQRIPGCRNVKYDKQLKTFINHKNYSIPLSVDVLDNDLDVIKSMSMNRDLSHIEDNVDKRLYPIEDILEMGETFKDIASTADMSAIDWSKVSEETIKRFMLIILPPMIYNSLFGVSPKHQHKFISTVYMKQCGIPVQSAMVLFDRIAQIANWDDIGDVNIRHQNIRQIYGASYSVQIRV